MTVRTAPSAPHVSSAQGLASVVALNPATILGVDAAGIIVYANHGPSGEPAADVTGRSVVDLVAPEHADRVRAAIARTITDQKAESFELVSSGPAGPTLAWRVDASPAPGEGLAFVLTDITAHKREEARLRRSEALLVDTQGVAHLGTWEWDITQPTAVWSEELYRIYGVTRNEYTPSYDAYLQKVHPDDRARVMAVTEACFKEHKPYSHDERIFRGDGEMRWLHTWAAPVLDAEGKLVRLLGVCQDITESKRNERAMRTQMMTRSLARRLLSDLIRRAQVPESVVRGLGRGLAIERAEGERSAKAYVESYSDMGLGALNFKVHAGGRYEFTATDLLERRSEAPLPTCFMTLGYLEGVVSSLSGKRALGNEMRCQSMGHEECKFVVAVQ